MSKHHWSSGVRLKVLIFVCLGGATPQTISHQRAFQVMQTNLSFSDFSSGPRIGAAMDLTTNRRRSRIWIMNQSSFPTFLAVFLNVFYSASLRSFDKIMFPSSFWYNKWYHFPNLRILNLLPFFSHPKKHWSSTCLQDGVRPAANQKNGVWDSFV